MFIICVVLYFVGGVIYVLFCDATTQKWALNKEVNAVEKNITNIEQKDSNKIGLENLAFDLTITTKF